MTLEQNETFLDGSFSWLVASVNYLLDCKVWLSFQDFLSDADGKF